MEEKLSELQLAINPSLNAVGNIIAEQGGHKKGLHAESVKEIINLLLKADNRYLEAYDEGFAEGKEEVKNSNE